MYFIEIKIVFGKNTCDNPNNYTLTKVYKFNCAVFSIYKNQLKVIQNNHHYSFDMDEIDDLFIKLV